MREFKVDIKHNGTSFEGWIHADDSVEEIQQINPMKLKQEMDLLLIVKSMIAHMREFELTSFEINKV